MPGAFHHRRHPGKRLTLLVILVIFVFAVLLVSGIVSSCFLFLLNHLGLMQPVTAGRLPVLLFFMLAVSLLVGIIITSIAGKLTLRPVTKFVDATKEIASGNFDVRIGTGGPYEFGRLAASFNDMARELGSIETLRDDFVSNISHEFKTPVTSIKGFAKLLKKGSLTEEQREEYLDIILMEAERLTQLSTNVLLLSKLNSADRLGDVAEFSLDEQLRRVILLLDHQIDKKGLEVTTELPPCQITSNGEMLQQVWMNLLGNAIKFTARGGQIAVELSSGGDQARVVIRDTGCGMDPEVFGRIFDKFYQGERSHSSEGNGLGLSLVKRIVELCGGAVEVQSEAGAGSAFTVTLPVRGAFAGEGEL